MFSFFMVDDSNIMAFEHLGNLSSNVKYAVEWWVFKPEKNGQQVRSSLFIALISKAKIHKKTT